MPVFWGGAPSACTGTGASSCSARVRAAACGLIVVADDKASVMLRKGGQEDRTALDVRHAIRVYAHRPANGGKCA